MFVAKIPYFIFSKLKNNSGYPLGSHFLGRRILQAAMAKLINSYLALSFFPFSFFNMTTLLQFGVSFEYGYDN